MNKRKGVNPDRRGRWRETRRSRKRGNLNEDILCEKTNLLSVVGKKENQSVCVCVNVSN